MKKYFGAKTTSFQVIKTYFKLKLNTLYLFYPIAITYIPVKMLENVK